MAGGSTRFEGRFDQGVKSGRGTLHFADGGSLHGIWADDALEGAGVATAADGSTVAGVFQGGELSGLVVETSEDGAVVFEGWYEDGARHGQGVEVQPLHGGTLRGVWQEGCATGLDFSLTYESEGVEVVLLGEWVDGQMKTATATADGAVVVAPTSDQPAVYSFDPSTATRIAADPLLPDPYESITCYVAPSPLCGKQSIQQAARAAGGGGKGKKTTPASAEAEVGSAGEGLFAKRRLERGEPAAFYSGTRITHAEVDARDWGDNANTMSLTPHDQEVVLDVPKPFDAGNHAYCATLGHKANHSSKANAKYDSFLHPRFGLIKGVVAVEPIEVGEEITVDYGYQDEKPAWFTRDLWGPTTKFQDAQTQVSR